MNYWLKDSPREGKEFFLGGGGMEEVYGVNEEKLIMREEERKSRVRGRKVVERRKGPEEDFEL
jgi:hypothetical protein